MYNDITGIILAGGKSSRMGQNKSFLVVNNKTVIERITELMSSVFTKLILITNSPGEYRMLGLNMYEDIYKNSGPLAGIHSGLVNSDTNKNFIISCDVPLMTTDIIKYIIEFKTEKKITVCSAERFLQPLAGLYHKSLAPSIESFLLSYNNNLNHNTSSGKSKCKMMKFIETYGAEILTLDNTDFYKGFEFFNLNTPENFNQLLKINQNLTL